MKFVIGNVYETRDGARYLAAIVNAGADRDDPAVARLIGLETGNRWTDGDIETDGVSFEWEEGSFADWWTDLGRFEEVYA